MRNKTYKVIKDEKGAASTKKIMPSAHFNCGNIWMLKATGFNRGRGIHVFSKLEELKTLLEEYTIGYKTEIAS